MHPLVLFGLVAAGVTVTTWSSELIPGGHSSGRPRSSFNYRALRKGTRVEMEHTSDPMLAEEIARDHLSEFPDYYDELEKMERRLKRRHAARGKR